MLHRLYNLTTGSGNPSYLSGVLPGGAGAVTTGTTVTPMISAPRIEESLVEVLDVSAPTNIGTSGTTLALPAPSGKLLVMDYITGAFGARWKQSNIYAHPMPGGQYGIVFTPGETQTTSNSSAGYCVTTAAGNEAQYGTKSVVMYEGPIQAYITTMNPTTAISAGMALCADGQGNLTYAGASPAAGTVLARALGPVASNVSIPVLQNVYVGGY